MLSSKALVSGATGSAGGRYTGGRYTGGAHWWSTLPGLIESNEYGRVLMKSHEVLISRFEYLTLQ